MMKRPLMTATALILTAACWGTVGYAQFYGQADQSTAGLNADQNQQENVVFILDASDSMNEKVGGRLKMDVAKEVVLSTIRNMPSNINVGLRVYGHRLGNGGFALQGPFGAFTTGGDVCRQTQLLVAPATGNRAQIASKLINVQAVGKTPITYSLKQSILNDFNGLPGKKTIILVSDGRETCSYNPCELALDVVRSGINVKINTVGFGTRDKVADDQLKCIALSTKGKYYNANTAAELAKSLQDSSQVQTSVQAKIYTGQ